MVLTYLTYAFLESTTTRAGNLNISYVKVRYNYLIDETDIL